MTIYRYTYLRQDVKSLINLFKKPNINGTINIPIIIVPTTCCNAKCVFCAYKFLEDKKLIMNFSLFKRIVDNLREMNISNVSLTATVGDAMLDNNLKEKIDYLTSNNFKISLVTNGILMDKHMDTMTNTDFDYLMIDLADFNPFIDSKVYGITPEQSIKRIENIISFLKKRSTKNHKGSLYLSFRGIKSNREIIQDMKKTEIWNYRHMFKLNFLRAYDNWGGIIKKNDLIGIQKLKISPKIKRFPCVNLYSISILPDGDVRVCGCRMRNTLKDELVIGNINNQNLKDIIMNKKHKDLLGEFIKGNLPNVCKECSFYKPRIE